MCYVSGKININPFDRYLWSWIMLVLLTTVPNCRGRIARQMWVKCLSFTITFLLQYKGIASGSQQQAFALICFKSIREEGQRAGRNPAVLWWINIYSPPTLCYCQWPWVLANSQTVNSFYEQHTRTSSRQPYICIQGHRYKQNKIPEEYRIAFCLPCWSLRIVNTSQKWADQRARSLYLLCRPA